MQVKSPTLFIEINHLEFVFVVIDNLENNEHKLLYKNSVPLEGMKNNKISDFNLVFDILKKNIYLIEKNLNYIFRDVILVLNYFDYSLKNLSGFKKLNGSQLVKENITYIINSLKSEINKTQKDKTIIHIFNVKYLLDKKEIENLPIGLFGNFYSHELSFFLIGNNDYKNLINIVQNCNLKIKKIISKDFLKGSYIVNKNSNLESFFKIEIDKKKSHIFFFENSSLRFIEDFKFGSDLILNDISKVTGIKKENVINILSEIDFSKELGENDLIEKKYFLEKSYRKIKKKLLLEIADARIQEIAEILLTKNSNISNFVKKDLPIFLQVNDKQNLDLFSLNYKLFFSKKGLFNLKIYEDINAENFYINANKIVQYGWSKEAVPIVQEQKSKISRLFNLFFK